MKTAFAGALLCLLMTGIVPAKAARLHPDCNVLWPCESNHFPDVRKMVVGSDKFFAESANKYRSGLVSQLAAKLAQIQSACPGTVAISGVRHTYIAGTHRISLHASGNS